MISVHNCEQEILLASQNDTLVSPAIMLWMLTLILAVSIFAEKVHEGHLPERVLRGTGGAAGLGGIFAGLLLFSGLRCLLRNRCRYADIILRPERSGRSWCQGIADNSPLGWPM